MVECWMHAPHWEESLHEPPPKWSTAWACSPSFISNRNNRVLKFANFASPNCECAKYDLQNIIIIWYNTRPPKHSDTRSIATTTVSHYSWHFLRYWFEYSYFINAFSLGEWDSPENSLKITRTLQCTLLWSFHSVSRYLRVEIACDPVGSNRQIRQLRNVSIMW